MANGLVDEPSLNTPIQKILDEDGARRKREMNSFAAMANKEGNECIFSNSKWFSR